MAIHAAMVDRMDREIGRVLDQLRAMKALDNTLIFFLSDNGASAEIMVRDDGHDPAAAARLSRHAPLPRPGLVHRGQHAVSPAQDVGPRRGHHHAADRALAGGHRGPRRAAAESGPCDRPRADDSGSGWRQAARDGRRQSRSHRRRAGAWCRRLRKDNTRPARLSVVAARREPGDSRRRLEAGGGLAVAARPRDRGPQDEQQPGAWELFNLAEDRAETNNLAAENAGEGAGAGGACGRKRRRSFSSWPNRMARQIEAVLSTWELLFRYKQLIQTRCNLNDDRNCGNGSGSEEDRGKQCPCMTKKPASRHDAKSHDRRC